MDVDNEYKLGVVVVNYSIIIHYSKYSNEVLDEIIRRTYLNESFLRKLTQSMQSVCLSFQQN